MLRITLKLNTNKIYSLKLLLILFCFTSVSALAQERKDDHAYSEREKKKQLSLKKRDEILQNFLKDKCYCDDPDHCDPKKYYYQGRQFLSTYSMNRLIRQDITKITLNQDGSPVIGNYASVQYAENNTKVTLNTSFYNPFSKQHTEVDPIRSILSLNVKAGISDGVSTLFTNKNATAGTSVTIKYSILSPKTIYERYSMPDCNQLKLYRENLLGIYTNNKEFAAKLPYVKRQDLTDKLEKAKKALAAFNLNQKSQQIQIKKDSILMSLLDIKKEYRNLQNTLAPILKDTTRTLDERKKLYDLTREIKVHDLTMREQRANEALVSINYPDTSAVKTKLNTLVANIKLAENDLSVFENTVTGYDANAAIASTYDALYTIETKDVKWDYYKVKWLDLDGNLGGDKYQLFDETQPVGKQLSAKAFTSWSGGFTFNYFESGSPGKLLKNGYFVQWGVHLSNTNNLIGAPTFDVSTTDSYDSGNEKTTATSKKTAYKVPLTESYLRSLSFRFSAYQDTKQSASLNFYSTFALPFDKDPLKVDKRPQFLLGTGYTMAFLDKDKAKSVLNIELFLNFDDILNSTGEDTKFYQRREIGLRVGVPFSSIFINK